MMRLLISCLILRALVFSSQAAGQQLNLKDEAMLADQLRRIHPVLGDAFKQGNERLRAKDYHSAAAEFQKVVNGAPEFDAPYRHLALALALDGNVEQATRTMYRAVELNRSHENLATLARLEAYPGVGKTATPQAREQALRLFKEANQKKSDATALFLTAEIAMQLKHHADFKDATLQMMKAFPDNSESHYLNAILAASNREWSTAEEEIRRAGNLGLPPELVRQFLDSGVHRRANEWRYATYVGYAAAVWAVGLALLFILGKGLSTLTLKSIERTAGSKATVSPKAERLRKIYRWLIQIAGAYYYVSLPFVAILLIGVAGSIFYAFLALGRLPLRLLLILGFMTVLTIYKLFQSLFIKIPSRDPGRILKVEEAPRLWALTKEVAAEIGTRAVDEIRITPGTDVAVYERGTRKEKAHDRAKRILILGVGVLNGFRLQAFRAVLAHEYGHFTNRDTAGGDIALRVNNDMMKFAYAMALAGQAVSWNIGFLFFRLYHFLFRRISHGASRLQEVLADRMAALKYGADSFEEGLTHAIRRSIEFPMAANVEIASAINAGRGVSNLYGLSGETAPSVEEEVKKALRRPTSEDDTHPSANHRFRLVRALGNNEGRGADTTMVWDLFEDRQSITMEMTTLIDNSIARPGTPSPHTGVPTFREVPL
jgi:tetratricopeptide (TPR) repeat protein